MQQHLLSLISITLLLVVDQKIERFFNELVNLISMVPLLLLIVLQLLQEQIIVYLNNATPIIRTLEAEVIELRKLLTTHL